MERYETSLTRQQPAQGLSRRTYNALTFGLVTLSFVMLWASYGFASSGALEQLLGGHALAFLIAFVVATIAGTVLMAVGKAKQSVGLSLGGYMLFSLTFGVTLALALAQYTTATIAYAFGITACVSGIFLIAGVTFPQFFARLGGVLTIGLLAVFLVELVATLFFHADQTFLDYVVILLFCGFLGYDSLLMAADEPTVPNAIFHASNIYLDIVNVLIRVLDLLNDD